MSTGELEAELGDLIETSPLPAEPDWAGIDELLIEFYQSGWALEQLAVSFAG